MRLKRSVVLGCSTCLLFLGTLVAGCSGGAKVGGGEATIEATVGEATVEATVPGIAETTVPSAGQIISTVEVDETDFALNPAEITLDRPGRYVFRATNSGGVMHALEIEGNGIEKATRNIQPGESAGFEVDLQPGTYDLYCPVGNHKQLGMDGTVTVRRG